ncbi:MAG TPA: MEDS domain-containing protein [Vicinamibacterales bacterium]|nr:MEDS domain-containing protein [Vicinamibacterales bacterium]
MSDSGSADWSRIPPQGHAVQYYRSDEELLRLLTRYVGSALVSGDVAVVIGTRAHRTALDRRLAARGFDVTIARGEGRYISLDAQATLDRFVSDTGEIDGLRAHTVISELLDRASGVVAADGGPARVFAFGEMVALLVAQRRADAAIALEEVWNTLATIYAFTLACGYPMSVFTARHAASFVRICGQHTHVFHASDRDRAEAADCAT